MKKILIYSHDTFGLGNIRRMMAIAQSLVGREEQTSVLILSGSPMLHAFRIPQGIDYVKLPCLTRGLHGDYSVKFLGMDYDATVRLRSNLILSTLLDFEPDLVLVDKKPLGVSNELSAAINLLQHRANRPRMVLLLRDILDEPERTREIWRKNHYYDAIAAAYDKILVVGSREIFDVAQEYGFPPECAAKVSYCGYLRRDGGLTPRQALRERLGVGSEPMVLVTAGGGEDGYRLLSCYVHGMNTLSHNMPVRSVLLCGPEMSESQRRNVREASSGNPRILVEDFTDDMMSYMAAADLVVSMGGYNTVCEILSANRRAIVVPRVRPALEQWIRAERLAGLGLIRAVHPDSLSPRNLVQAVRRELMRGQPRRGRGERIDLHGLDKVRAQISRLLDFGSTGPAYLPAREAV